MHKTYTLKHICQFSLILLIFPPSEGLNLLSSVFTTQKRGVCVYVGGGAHMRGLSVRKVMSVCEMTRGRGLGEPSSLSPPLPGLNLSLSDPNQPPPSRCRSHPPQLRGVINESTRPTSATEGSQQSAAPRGSTITGLSYPPLLPLFTSQSDVEKSLLTLKAGYRSIRGGVLKAVRGKRQINTFHIPLRRSAIDHGPRVSTAPLHIPAWSVAVKRAILIRRDRCECLAALLLSPPAADLSPSHFPVSSLKEPTDPKSGSILGI